MRSATAHKLRGFIPSFADQAPHQPLFDTLTATADDLQKELINGTIKSTQIVEEYHRSILAYNGVLNAVYELASGAMQRAKEMDDLRASGKFLGPFHGIPILVKVPYAELAFSPSFLTALGQHEYRSCHRFRNHSRCFGFRGRSTIIIGNNS